jgi:hypothetical protein
VQAVAGASVTVAFLGPGVYGVVSLACGLAAIALGVLLGEASVRRKGFGQAIAAATTSAVVAVTLFLLGAVVAFLLSYSD